VAKKPAKHGLPWTNADVKKIGTLARQGVETTEIARKLERTEAAVRSKATKETQSLKPVDPKN